MEHQWCTLCSLCKQGAWTGAMCDTGALRKEDVGRTWHCTHSCPSNTPPLSSSPLSWSALSSPRLPCCQGHSNWPRSWQLPEDRFRKDVGYFHVYFHCPSCSSLLSLAVAADSSAFRANARLVSCNHKIWVLEYHALNFLKEPL